MLIPITKKAFFHEANLLLKLAIPLVLSGFIQAAIVFFSTLFLAKLGEHELVAGALVSWLFSILMNILMGTLSSVNVLVALKYGEKNHKEIADVLRDGLSLALICTLPSMFLLWNIGPILLYFGQQPFVITLAQPYVEALIWGVPADFIGMLFIQFLIGLGHARTSMCFTLLLVLLNVVLSYLLIFGKFGFPALGIAGVGWGATYAFWIAAITMVIYLLSHHEYRCYFQMLFNSKSRFFFRELCSIGFPMGLMYGVEICFFFVISLIMGYLGSSFLAANQIVLQFLTQFSWVIAFSMAQAITTRMGHALGDNRFSSAYMASHVGILMTFIFTIIVSAFFYFSPEKLIALDFDVHDKKNSEIIYNAKQFLAIAAFFQIVDALRITLFGALRAFKDTQFPLLASLAGLWVVAFPMGYLLSIWLRLGAIYLWWGLFLGTICSTVLLCWRFLNRVKAYSNINELK